MPRRPSAHAVSVPPQSAPPPVVPTVRRPRATNRRAVAVFAASVSAPSWRGRSADGRCTNAVGSTIQQAETDDRRRSRREIGDQPPPALEGLQRPAGSGAMPGMPWDLPRVPRAALGAPHQTALSWGSNDGS
jgi:hypothetical protein